MERIKNIICLKCLICGKEYPSDSIDYVCKDHGDNGILDVIYDYNIIKDLINIKSLKKSGVYSMWRYKPMLPVIENARVPRLAVGWTPMYDSPVSAKKFGLKRVWIKDDGRQPTGSLKDRASALAVVKADEKNAKILTTASTGNAAAALSGFCAGKPNVIFVPDNAPPAKIAQLLVFGSTVIMVKGSYNDAFELCLEASKLYKWYNRSTGYNPYMTEGKKTAAYEICEQLEWNPPDAIFVSVGDGCIIGSLHKGLKDLIALGWIKKMPRLFGVQSAGSDYMYQAWKNNEDIVSKPGIKANTVADSISADLPRDRIKALAAVKETGGAYIRLEDSEILAAIPKLARVSGVFAEPAGAAAYAGIEKASEMGLISGEVVALITGVGLKDISGAMKSVVETKPYHIEPSIDALKSLKI